MGRLTWLLSLALCGCLVLGGCSEGAALQRPSEQGPAIMPSVSTGTGSNSSRLLTRPQFDNTVRDLLGDDSTPSKSFPREPVVDGFENNAQLHQVTPLLIDAYAAEAERLAQEAVARGLGRYTPCDAAHADLACGRAFVERFVRAAFRRPAEPAELSLLSTLFETTFQAEGLAAAQALLIETVLQTPQFLYRLELVPGDVQVMPSQADSWAMASRLSYFLWNSMPDEQLFQLAEAGELTSTEQIAEQARRMLDDPRAHAVVIDFHRQWLLLSDLTGIARDGIAGNTMTPYVESFRSSLDRFIDDAFWSEGNSLRTLLTSQRVYLDGLLAPLYGVSNGGAEMVPTELPASERSGLLSQPGLMAMLALPNQSSPVRRGVFVRERLMCLAVGTPPPNANIPPDPNPNLTTRERFRVHTESPACATCHKAIDGIGFGFEQYDALGRFRDREPAGPVDATGEVLGVPEADMAGPFNGVVELSARLAQSSSVSDCVARQWYRYALGRLDEPRDQTSLQAVQSALRESHGDLKGLLVAITTSDAFRARLP